MPWHSIRNEAEIERILDFAIQEGTDLEVRLPGDEATYLSRVLRLISQDKGRFDGSNEEEREIAIKSLIPLIGNERIQTSPEADILFSDLIPEVTLFAEGLSMKFSAIVRHKTEIDEGPNAGVLVGVESEVSLEDFFDELSSAPSRLT